jgi:hypothetical protein
MDVAARDWAAAGRGGGETFSAAAAATGSRSSSAPSHSTISFSIGYILKPAKY